MQARKDKIVAQLTGGIEMLSGRTKSPAEGPRQVPAAARNTCRSRRRGAAETVEANHVILATAPARVTAGLEVDNETICDNIGALA